MKAYTIMMSNPARRIPCDFCAPFAFWPKLFILLLILIATVLLTSCSTRPPASRLVFERIGDKESEIYTIEPNGSGLLRIAGAPPGASIWLSPDGVHVALLSMPTWASSSQPTPGDLTIIDVATGETIAVLPNVGQTLLEWIPPEENITWSPDGEAIAFLRNSDGAYGTDISVYDLTNQQVTEITHDEAIERAPEWSVDGRRIAFAKAEICDTDGSCNWEGAFWKIVLAQKDGTQSDIVADMQGIHSPPSNPLTRSLCNLSWSPSGERIMFQDGCANSPSYYGEVYVANINNGEIQQITHLSDDQAGLTIVHYQTEWLPKNNSLRITYSKEPFGAPQPDQVPRTGILEIEDDSSFATLKDISGPNNISAELVNWSPNGQFLAWLKEHKTTLAELTDAQLSVLPISSNLPINTCDTPQWSLDGHYVAYTKSQQEDCPTNSEQNVVVISFPDGQVIDIANLMEGNNRLIGWIPDTSQ